MRHVPSSAQPLSPRVRIADRIGQRPCARVAALARPGRGSRTDADGRVLAARGGVVEALYAAGNVAACVFGPGYPAGGATLGPAITFGYLAGGHLATQRAPALAQAG